MKSDELQVRVTTTGIPAQMCFSATHLPLIRPSATHFPVSFSLLYMQVSRRLSYLQHFAALVYCRYLYPTHLQLTTPLSTYEAPYFLSTCSPPLPTNPMSVLLLLVFVLTFLLLIPVSKSRIRVQSGRETRSSPLFPPPPLAISLSPSLSLITGSRCGRDGKVTQTDADGSLK